MKFIAVLLVFLLVSAFDWIDMSKILEMENVHLFKMEMDNVTQIPTSISGLCFESAYSVSEIQSKKEGNALIILVKIHPVGRKGESGNFNYHFDITNDIDEIKFGEKKTILWTRNVNQPRI